MSKIKIQVDPREFSRGIGHVQQNINEKSYHEIEKGIYIEAREGETEIILASTDGVRKLETKVKAQIIRGGKTVINYKKLQKVTFLIPEKSVTVELLEEEVLKVYGEKIKCTFEDIHHNEGRPFLSDTSEQKRGGQMSLPSEYMRPDDMEKIGEINPWILYRMTCEITRTMKARGDFDLKYGAVIISDGSHITITAEGENRLITTTQELCMANSKKVKTKIAYEDLNQVRRALGKHLLRESDKNNRGVLGIRNYYPKGWNEYKPISISVNNYYIYFDGKDFSHGKALIKYDEKDYTDYFNINHCIKIEIPRAQFINTLSIARAIQDTDNDKVILKFGPDILVVSMKGSKEEITQEINISYSGPQFVTSFITKHLRDGVHLGDRVELTYGSRVVLHIPEDHRKIGIMQVKNLSRDKHIASGPVFYYSMLQMDVKD